MPCFLQVVFVCCLRCLPDAPRKWLRRLPGRNPGDKDLNFGRFWQRTNHWQALEKVNQSEQNPGEAHESALIQSIPSRQMHFRAASFFTHCLQRTFAPPWTSGFTQHIRHCSDRTILGYLHERVLASASSAHRIFVNPWFKERHLEVRNPLLTSSAGHAGHAGHAGCQLLPVICACDRRVLGGMFATMAFWNSWASDVS